MDDDIGRMVIGVRADTSGFARDVEAMRATLEGPLVEGADRAGRSVETALKRAVRNGKLEFDSLKSVALAVLAEIAAAAIRSGIEQVTGSGALTSGLTSLLGAPGRATGGPVSPNRPYWVGERGPQLFVPTSSGHVAAMTGGGPRDVRVSINVQAGGGDAPAALGRSSRQVARAVRAALMEAG
jgi:hypothetical protein